MKQTKVETLFDMGPQENLISQSLVKKLGLETKPHLKPYPLGWEPSGLPPKREIQHEIHLQDDAPFPNIGMYMLLAIEMEEIKKQVQELLSQGVIRPISSPCSSPIVLAPKKDDTWGMCMDYKALKKITVKNVYPLPDINDLLDQLINVVYFTKLDLCGGYHLVWIAEQVVWKTALKKKQGLFERLVIPFRVCNAPSTFIRVINDIFRPFLDDFVLVYLDDIVAYNTTWEDHVSHVKNVLDVLQKEKLYVKMSKC
eukprot:PITA_33751